MSNTHTLTGTDPGFQARGDFKKLRRAEGGAKIFGVFRVENHDFTPKNHIFSNFKGGAPSPLDSPLPNMSMKRPLACSSVVSLPSADKRYMWASLSLL